MGKRRRRRQAILSLVNLPEPFWIATATLTSGLPTIRKVARPVNTSAFIGTNPTDEPIAFVMFTANERSILGSLEDW